MDVNDVTARFAAMRDRVAADEQKARRLPGESEQAALDRLVAEELASLDDKNAPPPRAIDPYESPPEKPATNDARGRACAYVARLIGGYLALRRTPGAYKINVTAQIGRLRQEYGLMQSTDPRGAVLARRWDFLCGDLV